MGITRTHHTLVDVIVGLCPQVQSNQAKTTCGSGKRKKIKVLLHVFIVFSVLFRFISDASVNGGGFIIEYSTIEIAATTPTNNATTVMTTTTSANSTTHDSNDTTNTTTLLSDATTATVTQTTATTDAASINTTVPAGTTTTNN